MLEGTLDLVRKSQDGDEVALTNLMKVVKTYHMPRYVGRYRGRNVLVSDAEIESEFLLGVFKALPKAKLDVGNPLNFMCWKGSKAVQSLFRQRIKKEVRYQCLECGDEATLGWADKVPVCKICESKDLHTWMVTSYDDEEEYSLIDNVSDRDNETVWQMAVYGIQIEELRERLSGRALELFDIIIIEGIDRDSSKNYLQEIADRWGVTSVAVAISLRKLRRDVLAYMEA